MTIRAHMRTAIDLARTDSLCQAKSLGTAGCSQLGWYHYTQFCALPKYHYGQSHRTRRGGVWGVRDHEHREWRAALLRQARTAQSDEPSRERQP